MFTCHLSLQLFCLFVLKKPYKYSIKETTSTFIVVFISVISGSDRFFTSALSLIPSALPLISGSDSLFFEFLTLNFELFKTRRLKLERNPPRAQDIEWAVISAMMFEPESTVKKVIEAGEDIFYSPENAMVFKAIEHLFEHGDPIDQLTVSEQLEKQKQLDIFGGELTISGFKGDTVSPAFIDYHLKILKDKALLRKIILLTESVRNSCYDTSVDSSELLENMKTQICELR